MVFQVAPKLASVPCLEIASLPTTLPHLCVFRVLPGTAEGPLSTPLSDPRQKNISIDF